MKSSLKEKKIANLCGWHKAMKYYNVTFLSPQTKQPQLAVFCWNLQGCYQVSCLKLLQQVHTPYTAPCVRMIVLLPPVEIEMPHRSPVKITVISSHLIRSFWEFICLQFKHYNSGQLTKRTMRIKTKNKIIRFSLTDVVNTVSK